MRRRRGLVAAVALLAAATATTVAPALAAEPRTSLIAIEDEVMCVSCNVPLNIAESPQADDQRRFIRVLVDQGRTEEQVKAALVAEYGPNVLALPAREGFGIAAYAVPILVALLLLGVLATLVPRWRARRPAGAAAGAGPALSSDDSARLDEDLRRFDR